MVMFDSSHFPSGSQVEVRLHVVVDGNLVSHSYSAPVVNGFSAWGHPDLGAGAFVAELNLQQMSYSGVGIWASAGWNNLSALNGMDSNNVHYIASHGGPNHHIAGDGSEARATLSMPHYLSYRQSQIGYGVPPYNSTSSPSMNLVYIYSCRCGLDNSFISTLFPYGNSYGGISCEDQAVLTYRV